MEWTPVDRFGGLHVPRSAIHELMDHYDQFEKAADKHGNIASDLKRRMGALFNVYYSIWNNLISWGAAEKPRMTPSHRILREAAEKSLIDRLIIGARCFQIRRVAQRVAVEGKEKGFRVVHERAADPTFTASKDVQRRCREMEDFLTAKINREFHPTGIEDFLVKSVRGQLTIDRTVMVIQRDGSGRPISYWLIPPDDVKPRMEVLLSFMPKLGTTNIQATLQALWDQQQIDLSDKAYVQEVDGQILGAWRADEISVRITNPSDQLNRYGYGMCVPYDTRIETDHGKLMIGHIVRDKLQVRVRTYDPVSGSIAWRPIVNWFRRSNSEPLIRIAWRRTGHNGTGGFGGCLRCTPEHPILTDKGWRHARDVTVDDTIMVAGPTLSDDQEQIILGSLLGDLSWQRRRGGIPGLAGAQGGRQRDYAEWKVSALRSLGVARWDIKPTETIIAGHQAHSTGAVGFKVHSQHCLTRLHALTTVQGKKVVTRAWLDRIGLLGLAVWFMDDGAIQWFPIKSRDGRKRYFYRRSVFCTDGFSRAECEEIAAWVGERWGIRARVSCPPSTGKCRVKVSVAGTRRLFALIGDYVEYVAGRKQWKFPVVACGPEGVVPVPVVAVERMAKNFRHAYVFDIEVQGTHTFLVNGAVVHNSCLEESLEATTMLFYGLNYNKSMFTAEWPEAILVLKGNPDPVDVEAMKRNMFSAVGEAQGNRRMPVVSGGDVDGKTAEVLKLRDSLKDMQFLSLIRTAVSWKCAAYRAHPVLLNMAPDMGRDRPLIAKENEDDKIAMAQEEGFGSLCDTIARWWTYELIIPVYPDLKAEWSVRDQPSEVEQIDIWTKELALDTTMDELRAKRGKTPLEEATGVPGTFVGNAYFFQQKMAQQMEQQGALAGMQGQGDDETAYSGLQPAPGMAGGPSGAARTGGRPGGPPQPGARPGMPAAPPPMLSAARPVKKSLVFVAVDVDDDERDDDE